MVKAFRFRLARVQHLRRRAERDARRLLGVATTRLAEVQRALEAAVRLRENMEAEGSQLVQAGKVAAIPLQRALVAAAERGRREAETGVAKWTGEVEKAREAWSRARREVRSLELLEERQRVEWHRRILAEESREMDEIGRVRYLRQRGEES